MQLGKNDLPGAGKIDPWDDREVANKQYQERVSSEENISERREKAFAQKVAFQKATRWEPGDREREREKKRERER